MAEANLALGRVFMVQSKLSSCEMAFKTAEDVILAKEEVLQTIDERTTSTVTRAEVVEAGETVTREVVPKAPRIGHKVAGGQEDMDRVLSLMITLYSSQGRLAYYCSQYTSCAALSHQALRVCDDLASLRGGNYSQFLAVDAKNNLAKLHDIVGDTGEATRLYKECLRTMIDCCGRASLGGTGTSPTRQCIHSRSTSREFAHANR